MKGGLAAVTNFLRSSWEGGFPRRQILYLEQVERVGLVDLIFTRAQNG